MAKLLGVPLLDRAISSHVAAQLHVSLQEAKGGAVRRSLPDRLLSALVPSAAGVITTSTDTSPRDLAALPGEADLFRQQADAIMRAALTSGAVIFGRAGTAALWNEPGVLRVRLLGPAEVRIAQAARIENIDEATARHCPEPRDIARLDFPAPLRVPASPSPTTASRVAATVGPGPVYSPPSRGPGR